METSTKPAAWPNRFDHGESLSRDCWHCGKRINGGPRGVEGTDFVAYGIGNRGKHQYRELHLECAEEASLMDDAPEEIRPFIDPERVVSRSASGATTVHIEVFETEIDALRSFVKGLRS